MHPVNPKGTPTPVRYKVLLVDDDAVVLRGMAAGLELEPELEVFTCSSADSALAQLSSGAFHVVCSDYSMCGMTGLELLERASRLAEPIGCLLLTGSSVFVGRGGSGANGYYVLQKPTVPDRLSALILQLAGTTEMKRKAKRSQRADAAALAAGDLVR